MPEWCIKCNTIVEMYNGQGFERDWLVLRGAVFFSVGPTGMKIISKIVGSQGVNVLV
jgi:hypothetical protein